MSSPREDHLTAVYAAQLALGQLGGLVGGARDTWQKMDVLLTLALGDNPETDPARTAVAISIQLMDCLADAVRLADRIDELLTEYRKAI